MSEVLCECAQCGQDIEREDLYVKDNDDNCFCDVDCAIEFYGLRKTSFDEEYGGSFRRTVHLLHTRI